MAAPRGCSTIGTVVSWSSPSGCGIRLVVSRSGAASRTAGSLARLLAAAPAKPTVPRTWPVRLVTSSRFELNCAGKSSTTSWTVAGSLVATAALSGGASAITRAIVVNVRARVVWSSLTIAPVAVISRCSPFSASRMTVALTR